MKESQNIDISTTAHSFVAFYGKAKITPVTSLEDTLSPPTDTDTTSAHKWTNVGLLQYYNSEKTKSQTLY